MLVDVVCLLDDIFPASYSTFFHDLILVTFLLLARCSRYMMFLYVKSCGLIEVYRRFGKASASTFKVDDANKHAH
jgi:hypothetical protein